ncbi:hypothetical protein OV203_48440 [Nannocystis sp. ILAH1]|uniref:hypothetical protein n=1 Tax=unclassified Nannocystis TaxID=2627009 RepID=UPI00226E246F|nr:MULTISPECIES: hypothetical protein [unclassified Nannocystis]MCY0995051.1 hypothetical protein [Nannocystis sp. ILAH1]MCY1069723.1 hypothetical protein [Nannocystis sp. RBIL2]
MRILGLVVVLLSACSERPLPGESAGESTTTGAMTTTGEPSPTTLSPTTLSPTTESPTTTPLPMTTPTSPGDPTTGELPTTTFDVTTAVTTEFTTGFPTSCGPPCPAELAFEGNLDVGATPGDFSCVTVVQGNLRIDADASPADVATLVNLRQIAGNLTIRDQPGLADLSAFACLERVNELTVQGMPQLADLSGLSRLDFSFSVTLDGLGITSLPSFGPGFTGAGELFLRDNPALTDLGAAANWTSVLPTLVIQNSPALADLSPLAGVLGDPQQFYSVSLIDLPAVTSLEVLKSLVDVGGLQLVGLPGVSDLSGLAGLERASLVALFGLPQVTSLSGLSGLERVESSFSLGHCEKEGMDGLTSLAGLDSLTFVGKLSIAHCDALTTLSGAPTLGHVNQLAVTDNPLLAEAAFDAFVTAVGSVPGECFNEECGCQ